MGLTVWDVQKHSMVSADSSYFLLYDTSFSSQNNLFSLHGYPNINVLNLSNGNILKTIDATSGSFNQGGSILATISDPPNNLRIWSVPDFTLLATYAKPVDSLAFYPDGKSIVILTTGMLKNLSVKDLSEIGRFQGGPFRLNEMKFTADGKWLVGMEDIGTIFTVRVWSTETKLIHSQKIFDHQVSVYPKRSFTLSDDSQTIVFSVGGSSETTKPTFFHLPTMQEIGSLPTSDNFWFGDRVALNPDGSLLAVDAYETSSVVGRGRVIQLWDIGGKKLLYSILAPQLAMRRMAFSPDGSFLFTSSDDGVLRIWGIKP